MTRRLTERQWQVLTLAAQGLTTDEISVHLDGMSRRTVDRHRAECIIRLGARNVTHAVAIAISRDIVSLEDEIPKGQEYQPKLVGRPAERIAAGSNEVVATWLKRGGRIKSQPRVEKVKAIKPRMRVAGVRKGVVQ